MLLSFMVLAVPVVLAASRTVGDLERNSNIWDKRLHAMYNAGSGVEAAIFETLNDPNFDDGLTPTDPSKELIVNVDGEDVTVTVSKIFTGASLDGLGLVVSKAVIPTSTSAYTTTTFSYTITVKNEGTGAHELEELKDRLPAGFTYNSGTTTGDITTAEPELGLKPPGGEVSPNPPKEGAGGLKRQEGAPVLLGTDKNRPQKRSEEMLSRNHPDRIKSPSTTAAWWLPAGLLPMVTNLGLPELHDLGDAPGRANAGDKMMTLWLGATGRRRWLRTDLHPGRHGQGAGYLPAQLRWGQSVNSTG